jgi:probable H4MPT-linked C1 transfer pathway protein
VAFSMPGRRMVVWCTDGRFRSRAEVQHRPQLAAASNWLALAEVSARLEPGQGRAGLLIDAGSTTIDLIPLFGGRAVPVGRTDTDRLATGELVYAGVRRTPVCAVLHAARIQGRRTTVAAELFATTLDAYLTLGRIAPDEADLATADGRPATIEHARARLARMVGADRDEFTPKDAAAFALAIHSALLSRLRRAAARVLAVSAITPQFAVVSGSGEFLAHELARRLFPNRSPVSLTKLWGQSASAVACARAVAILAREQVP